MRSCIWLTPPRLAFSSYLRGRSSTNYYIWKVVVVVNIGLTANEAKIKLNGTVNATALDLLRLNALRGTKTAWLKGLGHAILGNFREF